MLSWKHFAIARLDIFDLLHIGLKHGSLLARNLNLELHAEDSLKSVTVNRLDKEFKKRKCFPLILNQWILLSVGKE